MSDTISIIVKEQNAAVEEKFSAFIQEKSNLEITIESTLSKVSSCQVKFDGSFYSKQAERFDVGIETPVVFDHEKITGSGTLSIEASVSSVLKQGESVQVAKTQTEINVLPYSGPKITEFVCYRCNNNGTENPEGTRVKATYAYEIAEVNGLNDKRCALYYREIDAETWTTLGDVTENYSGRGEIITDSVFDVEKTYVFKVEVEDFFDCIQVENNVPYSFTLIDFNVSGKGMAIGKVSEIEDVLELGMKTKFVGGILHNVLESGTDLNSVMVPNKYVLVSENEYSNMPTIDHSEAILEIVGIENENLRQTITTVSKTVSQSFERFHDSDGWSEWMNPIAKFMSDIMLTIYPVGSIYMSVNETSPETLFGGSWERIEDKFLLSAGSTYEAGTEGGETSHKHVAPLGYNTSNKWMGVTYAQGENTVTFDGSFAFYGNAMTDGSGPATWKLAETGPANNIPPYLAVYVWKRTA